MTPAMIASEAPAQPPASMAERNIVNLANQPASGGMPASDARNMVISTVSAGDVLNRPEYDSISALRVRRAMAMTHANAPRFMAP